jgi:hypothetical protein
VCGANVFASKALCFKCKSPKGTTAATMRRNEVQRRPTSRTPADAHRTSVSAGRSEGGVLAEHTTLFLSGLPVASEGKGLRQKLLRAFKRFAEQPSDSGGQQQLVPRVRVARNAADHTVGYGWVERLPVSNVEQALALNGQLVINGCTVSVSLCCSSPRATTDVSTSTMATCLDQRNRQWPEWDTVAPDLSYSDRRELWLGSAQDVLEQPTADRIGRLLRSIADIGLGASGSGSEQVGKRTALSGPCNCCILETHPGSGIATTVLTRHFAHVISACGATSEQSAEMRHNLPLLSPPDMQRGLSLHDVPVVDPVLPQVAPGSTINALLTCPYLQQLSLLPCIAFVYQAETTVSNLVRTCRTLLFCEGAKQRPCDLVAALVPEDIDFAAVAAELVALNSGEERCHPFSVAFERPHNPLVQNTSACKPHQRGMQQWEGWQLILVTAPLEEISTSKGSLQFGNAKLDHLVHTLLEFHTSFAQEHRPTFYDWEKRRAFSLTRWKGVNPRPPNQLATSASQTTTTSRTAKAATVTTMKHNSKLPSSPPVNSVGATRRAGKLVFVLFVEGSLSDRARGASWLGFDRGYRCRRDALARIVAAGLWASPMGRGGAPETLSVHEDCVCYAIHEGSGEVLELTPAFAHDLGVAPTEGKVLTALGVATKRSPRPATETEVENGCLVTPGLTRWCGGDSVALASEWVLQRIMAEEQSGRLPPAVLEMHEDKHHRLPAYSSMEARVATKHQLLLQAAAPRTMIVALGAVQDHLRPVATFVATAQAKRLPCVSLNLGPVSEFSSKVLHVLQDHHTCGRLAPAVEQMLTGASVAGTPPQPSATHPNKEPTSPCGLHFWVPASGVSLESLPTTQECRGRQPSLAVWRPLRPFWRPF